MLSAADALRRSPVFAGLPADALSLMAESLEPVAVRGGTRLFLQGDPGDAAYVVLSGRLRLTRETDAGPQLLRELGRGALFGEFALLTGAARTASATAVRDCELGRLPRDRFERLMTTQPSLALAVSRHLATLLAAAPTPGPAAGARRPSVIVLRVVDGQADVRAAGDALAAALRAAGPCALLDEAAAVAALGADVVGDQAHDAHAVAIARWLHAVESDHAHVVCVTHDDRPDWTAACRRQADLVLDLLPADRVPAAVVPAGATDAPCRHELVVLHPDGGARTVGTARWMARRPYARRHHVRLGTASDWGRLARHITGTSIGLALGGGGARGFAHLGLLRALGELGIPVDEVGGTSIGSLVAAQWAAGMSVDEMTERHREVWARFKPHKAYTLPLLGLVRASALLGLLETLFGDLQYEDCWIEAFACSTNLTKASASLHRSGRILDGCIASMAIPGLGPAVALPDRTLHVDGALVDNLPVSGLETGFVIASDVSAHQAKASGYPSTPTPWQVLRDRFLGRGDQPYFPSLMHTLLSSILLGGVRQGTSVSVVSDLHLKMPVGAIGLFAFDRLDEIAAIGHRHAHERLTGWWRGDGDRPTPRVTRPARVTTGVVASLAALLLASPAAARAQAGPDAAPTAATAPALRVTTTLGPVVGRDSAGVTSWRGIPYAAPPVGPLRWRPPAPPARWTTPRDASQFGPSCMQTDRLRQLFGGEAEPVSEDCLTLNVWSAAPAGAKRPVLVWIHGGGFTNGSGRTSVYDGTRLALLGAVVVTLNYRLGVFGFLAHPALSAEAAGQGSGAYGLLDQVAALEWVRREVAAFGGDPGNVTIFGESAGAFSVGYHMVSPWSRGLFHRAILQSGSPYRFPLPLTAPAGVPSGEAAGLRLVADLGAGAPGMTGGDAVAALRAIPAESLLARVAALPKADLPEVVDGTFLTEAPAAALLAGRLARVPVLIGSNADESTVLVRTAAVRTEAQLDSAIRAAYPPAFAERVRASYPAAGPRGALGAYRDLWSDDVFTAPARETARALAAQGVPVWRYWFTRVADGMAGLALGAFHAAELPFVFGVRGRRSPLWGTTAADSTLADAMSATWVRFAATGDPNGAGLPPWPRFTRAGDEAFEFGARLGPVPGPRPAALDVLGEVLARRARTQGRPTER